MSTKPFIELSRKHGVHILAGSILERSKGHKAYNTAVLIAPSGNVQARYRKINLFNARIGRKKLKESKSFLKGKRVVVEAVAGFRAGLSICYDLRFPLLYRICARKGAEILCVPSAFTKETGQAHWEVLLRARAIENLCYVLAPNQTGKDARGVLSYGHSMIVDPWGKVLARADRIKEGIIYATITRQRIDRARKILPAWKKGGE